MVWNPAAVPGTVAKSLALPLDFPPDIESLDWWYRCEFEGKPSAPATLVFHGLATFAEVWLNGELLGQSSNMHRILRFKLGERLREKNELVLCFRSVRAVLAQQRPRPRWKTALVEQQELRFVRTSLLGRIPGWTPPLPAIGPWRAVELISSGPGSLANVSLHANWAENMGRLTISAEVRGQIQAAVLRVGLETFSLTVTEGAVRGSFALSNVRPWWPQPYGEPTLYECVLEVRAASGTVVHALGRVGFRSVSVDTAGGAVQFRVNDRNVFLRGACLTTDDVRAIDSSPEATATSLALASKAGINLLRVGGTMVYASAELLRQCDELGIMLWQDFMFANMDYPFSDADFAASATAECTEVVQRLAPHPCVVAYCGGSEVEQQAAMMGLPAESWSNPFFGALLPEIVAQGHPGTPYFPSTPTGGQLPFSTAMGLTHYYGVGAYLRPLSDARAAGVRFTPECLGFANVPDAETLALLRGGSVVPCHHPLWKAGVPRDNGAGWDFDDVRDHYLRLLFGVDPVHLRSTDLERYLALSRVVSGELMLRVYAEWRREGSGCGGGLVWFWKDLRPGAGWGIVDSTNRPKAAFWYVRRAFSPQTVLFTDEGLNGLALHAHNESSTALEGSLELELLRNGQQRAAFVQVPVEIPAFGQAGFSAEALLGSFADVGYTYRFGPPRHDVVLTRLRSADGSVLGSDAWFPLGHARPMLPGGSLVATATAEGDSVVVRLECLAFIQAAAFSIIGFEAEDNYIHLAPGCPRRVYFRPVGTPRPFKLSISGLNLEHSLTVRLS